MTALAAITAIFGLLAGLGVFLYGMHIMGDGLESISGDRIKNLFSKISNNKYIGLGVGTAITAVIQSSSAVTVMLVGFVNAGLMTMYQAASIIFGANIGTTSTALIVALGFSGANSIDVGMVFAAFTGIGALMLMLSKKDFVQKLGSIIAGLGMIFIGLTLMSDAMMGLRQSPSVITFLAKIKNPMLLFLIGTLFTAIIQSSSAVSGIVITMGVAGMLTLDQGIYLIIGSNVGTCATALLACTGSNINAKRTAIFHLLINILGSAVFMLIIQFIPFASWMERWFGSIQLQIAMVHTIFNIATTIILMPFTKIMIDTIVRMTKKSEKDADNGPHLYFLNKNLLSAPPIAVAQAKKEVLNMASLARRNLELAMNGLVERKLEHKEELYNREAELDFMNKEIPRYLVELSNMETSLRDKKFLGTLYHVISDLERVGDYAENIYEYTEQMIKENSEFSEHALGEINNIYGEVLKVYELAMDTFEKANRNGIDEVALHEEEVDRLSELMAFKHISRLKNGTCTPETGAVYLNLSSDLERISDHMTNIANSVRNYATIEKHTPAPKIKTV